MTKIAIWQSFNGFFCKIYAKVAENHETCVNHQDHSHLLH